MVTVLLLDIDGVINAFEPLWPQMRIVRCLGFVIRWAPELITQIAALPVEVRWCSTWCGFGDQLGALETLLGITAKTAFEHRPASKTWADLKVEAALEVLAAGDRLIWIDDDEVAAGRRLYPALAEAEAAGRALLVQPESRRGLTAAHMVEIRAFAAAG